MPAMAGKSFDQRLHRLLLVLAIICSTVGLLLFFLRGGGGNTSFNINVLRGFVGIPSSNDQPKDKLLGGLLTTTIAASDEDRSCLSRYQAASYWRSSHHNPPSPHLLEKLRAYESLHKRCGPYTEFYNKSLELLKSNKTSDGNMECSYVVWLAEAGGLGNRMISIISGFLYAILNNKVLLLNYGEDFKDLFCEPFPDTTWALPAADFPIPDRRDVWGDMAPLSFGKLLKDKKIDIGMNSTSSLPFAYIHIMHDSSDMDSMFFCDGAQDLLRKLPWLLVRANNYYAPGLFLIPQYRAELDRLFPEKDTVFLHLARYLLHPTNSVWGYITRYYNSYLGNAKVRLGIQVRDLPFASAGFDYRLAQIINCTMSESLLPRIDLDESVIQNRTEDQELKAVLVASLDSRYYERIKDMYYEHSTLNGEMIGVYQASHEEYQQTSKRSHNVKALSEIYLLSFSDLLVTSEQSTFGYCAQGLGGLKPWIMKKPGGKNNPCQKATSMEPCFLDPPHSDCNTLKFKDPSLVVPHVRDCEDSRGVKLFN